MVQRRCPRFGHKKIAIRQGLRAGGWEWRRQAELPATLVFAGSRASDQNGMSSSPAPAGAAAGWKSASVGKSPFAGRSPFAAAVSSREPRN